MADVGPAQGGRASEPAEKQAFGPSKVRRMRAATAAAATRLQGGAPGKYWSSLSAADFINSSFAFAALAVLCGFPFLAVAGAAAGGDVRRAIVTRMGLPPAAARDVNALIAPGHQAVATLSVFSAILLFFGP